MEGKQRSQSQKNRRRDRAARMLKQKQAARAQGSPGDLSELEGDESPLRQRRPPPPTRKKRNKEPIFQEDIIDGFAFLCFKTYEDLEKTVNKFSEKSVPDEGGAEGGGGAPPESSPLLEEALPPLEKQKTTPKTNNNKKANNGSNNSNSGLQKVKKKCILNNKVNNALKQACSTNDEGSRLAGDEHSREPPRSASRDQLSDASSHASLERGYMCDSESGNERGSEPECDLFSSKSDSNYIAKKNNPGHSNCRSPPVLPPIHPVANGTHHPEPSTAVAAVTASASPANTVSAMVVGSASPREPQIGSPAVRPIACASPASPPAGLVPEPPFLQKGPSPATVPLQQGNKEDPSGSGKLLSNGYEFVNKFLHKRTSPVSSSASCRDSGVAVQSKPTAINVYDFVSDHSAPSSPDGVIFLSQSKFHHAKGVTTPPAASKEVSPSLDKVSNGHGVVVSNVCPSPVAAPASVAPAAGQNTNRSALDMSIKSNTPVKTEVMSSNVSAPPPPSLSANSDHRLHLIPQQQQLPQQQQQQPPSQQPPLQHQQARPPSYNIPYATSQPLRKMSSSPRMSPLTLSSPALPLPVLSSSSNVGPPNVNTRTFVTTTSTTLSSGSSHGMVGLSCSPVVTTSHPNTPTPVPPRDTHSSHSNSSLSSLSQLSAPLHSKDSRDGAVSRSHSNSSNHGPPISTAANTSAYTATSSLASLVFSKPHNWGNNSSGPILTTSSSSSLPSRSSPPPSSSLPLPPSLPPAHHSSPFASHPGPPPPPLLPVASHHGIFAPGSLTPTLPLDATTGPPYRAETLFPQPMTEECWGRLAKRNPDLLRRELDTRFLASQDHSIPIPPPPYMQTEVHQHGHMHQQGPFMGPPSLGAPLVTQPTPHLYEKYPKLDSSLYGRPSMGLSGYPPVSALFAPGGGASTPFAPPAHLTALQPKINSVPKTKSMKPGKWCAMHVRIAWEIYNHQQKQKRAEAHKAGIALAAAAKPPSDPMHATNHLFLPRQHDLSFSSSLLSAAASAHPRTPFEASSHHSTFLNPTPAHLGAFTRPSYPGFGAPGPGFSGLGPLALPSSSVLGPELRSGCLTQDPWGQRAALSFAGGSAPWGGLKEEAERDRIQQEQRKREEERKRAEQERREKEERERREQERREQERREMERREQERKEQERKEKERREQERREMERREMERREQERREQERREQERQKERDRELRLQHHLQKNSAIVMNGDLRDHHLHHHHAQLAREWQRSPVQPKFEPGSGLERHHLYNPRLDVKVKQERKEEEPSPRTMRASAAAQGLNMLEERSRKRPGSMEPEDMMHASRAMAAHGSMALGLASLDPARTVGHHGLVQSPAKDPLAHSQTSPLWGPLTPSPTVSTLSGTAVEHHYRSTREMLQGRAPDQDRRYDPLAGVMARERCSTSSELSRQLSNAIDLERQYLDREHAAAVAASYERVKLLPPPLRTNESPYMTPPTLPPASASSFFSPPVSPYLNSLCSASNRSKAGGPAPPVINGLPPPLIPCNFPVQNHSGYSTNRTSSPMAHKLAVSTANVLNLHESYFPKERREMNGHPSDLETHLRL